jgi:hypothetical protein
MKDPGSFRDPSGYIYYKNNKVFRVVNESYKKDYDNLMSSGLYDKLVNENLLIEHSEISNNQKSKGEYKTLEVERIPFISYPYEWSFNQFKDSILLTLKMQRICVDFNMTLKDATPFNIQFIGNKPIFIGTLSFELVDNENYVWKPYKQFCEMFLGPLCLMKYVDPNLNKLLINYINGVPLDLINKLLPLKSKFNLSVFMHFVLHNIVKRKEIVKEEKSKVISKTKHLNIIKQLESFVINTNLPNELSEWGDYNEETITEKKDYVIDKENSIRTFLKGENYNLTWDVGSNDGFYSRIIAEKFSDNLISFDIDWRCVDSNYMKCKQLNVNNVSPLILDLSNPTPSIGWMNKERSSIYERFGTPNLICCFAVIHHIINAGVPLEVFVEFLLKSIKDVIIEYVPISDPKCRIIFESRGEDFEYPTKIEFECLVKIKFNIIKQKKLNETDRVLYFLRKKT